jgi:hypothetical protein
MATAGGARPPRVVHGPPRVVHGGAGPLCGPTGTPGPWPRADATTTIGVAADPTVRDRPEASTTGPRAIVALAFRGGGPHRSRGRAVRGNGSSDRYSRPTGRTNGSAAATAPAGRHWAGRAATAPAGRHRTGRPPPHPGPPPHRGHASHRGSGPAGAQPALGLSPRALLRTPSARGAHGAGPPSRPCRRGSRAPVSPARGRG